MKFLKPIIKRCSATATISMETGRAVTRKGNGTAVARFGIIDRQVVTICTFSLPPQPHPPFLVRLLDGIAEGFNVSDGVEGGNCWAHFENHCLLLPINNMPGLHIFTPFTIDPIADFIVL